MKKKPVKKASSAKVASIAGKWMSLSQIEKASKLLGRKLYFESEITKKVAATIDDIDALAASVLSQREVK